MKDGGLSRKRKQQTTAKLFLAILTATREILKPFPILKDHLHTESRPFFKYHDRVRVLRLSQPLRCPLPVHLQPKHYPFQSSSPPSIQSTRQPATFFLDRSQKSTPCFVSLPSKQRNDTLRIVHEPHGLPLKIERR